MTEQLTLSPFRECFSNLKSLNLVIGSSLLPVCLNCSHLCILDTLLTQCFHWYAVFPSSQTIDFLLILLYYSRSSVFFLQCPSASRGGIAGSILPHRSWIKEVNKVIKVTLCQRNVSFGQLLVYTDWGGFTQELWGVCVCVCCCVSICRTHSVCLELSAIPSPTHPLPHLIKP